MIDKLKTPEDFESMIIGLDEKFSFSCNQCGKCCTEREDILLSPSDLFRASRKLNMTTEKFHDEYCESYVGGTSKVVIVRFKPRGSIRRCPMLKNRKCSIHDAKPAVCAMFPIGRGFHLDASKNLSEQITHENMNFIFTGAHCGSEKEYTVREWFEKFGIPIKDDFFIEWQKTIAEVGDIARHAEATIKSEVLLNLMYTIIFQQLYMEYDINKEFMPQFMENKNRLLSILRDMPGLNLGGRKNG